MRPSINRLAISGIALVWHTVTILHGIRAVLRLDLAVPERAVDDASPFQVASRLDALSRPRQIKAEFEVGSAMQVLDAPLSIP